VCWWVLLVVALSAQLVGGAMLGPPGRKNRYIDAELAVAVAQPAALVALGVLVALAVMPIPTRAAERGAQVLTVLVAGLLLLLLIYRLWTGAADDRGFDPESLAGVAPLLWAGLVPAGVLIGRLERVRRMGRRASAGRARQR